MSYQQAILRYSACQVCGGGYVRTASTSWSAPTYDASKQEWKAEGKSPAGKSVSTVVYFNSDEWQVRSLTVENRTIFREQKQPVLEQAMTQADTQESKEDNESLEERVEDQQLKAAKEMLENGRITEGTKALREIATDDASINEEVSKLLAVAESDPESLISPKLIRRAETELKFANQFKDQGKISAAIDWYNKVLNSVPDSTLADRARRQLELLEK